MLLEQKQRQQDVDRVTVSRGVQHKPKSARYAPPFSTLFYPNHHHRVLKLAAILHPRDTLPMTCMRFVLLWLRLPPRSIDPR
jgi:hypothetical protein